MEGEEEYHSDADIQLYHHNMGTVCLLVSSEAHERCYGHRVCESGTDCYYFMDVPAQ